MHRKARHLPFPNTALREARRRTPSPADPNRSISRAELAEAVSAWLWHTKGLRLPLEGGYIAKLERGAVHRTGSVYREGLRAVLGVSTDRDLGMDLCARLGFRPRTGFGIDA